MTDQGGLLEAQSTKPHLLNLPLELFQMIYDHSESLLPPYVKNISPYTQTVGGPQKRTTAALSRTCKQLHIEMQDKLYDQHFTLCISSTPWSQKLSSKIEEQLSPTFEESLAKVVPVHVKVMKYLDQDFSKQAEELEKVVERLQNSSVLQKFTFEVEVVAFRVEEWGWKKRVVDRKLRELRTMAARTGLNEKEIGMRYAMNVVAYSKSRQNTEEN